MKMSGSRPFALVVLVALLVGACSSPRGPVVATYEPETGSGGDSGLLVGTLHVGTDCVTVVDADGTTWVPVFPEGAAGLSSSADALVWDGRELADGDEIQLEGGENEVGPDLPRACDGAAWIVTSRP